MKALIFKGKVVQVAEADFPVNSELKWIDIFGLTPQPEVGWIYDGKTFSAPPDPPPPTAQELALAAIPKLREEMICWLARFAVGEATKDVLVAKWGNLKAKLMEAKVEF